MQATVRSFFVALLLISLQMGAFVQLTTKTREPARPMLVPATAIHAPTAQNVPNPRTRVQPFCLGKPKGAYCDSDRTTLHQCFSNQDAPRHCFEGCISTDKEPIATRRRKTSPNPVRASGNSDHLKVFAVLHFEGVKNTLCPSISARLSTLLLAQKHMIRPLPRHALVTHIPQRR